MSLEVFKLKEVLQAVEEKFSTQLDIRKVRLLEPDENPKMRADKRISCPSSGP